jgi:hypothetical protein
MVHHVTEWTQVESVQENGAEETERGSENVMQKGATRAAS